MSSTLFFINPENTDDFIRVDVLFHPCVMFKYDDKVITIDKSKDFVYGQAPLNDGLYQYGMISKMVKTFNISIQNHFEHILIIPNKLSNDHDPMSDKITGLISKELEELYAINVMVLESSALLNYKPAPM